MTATIIAVIQDLWDFLWQVERPAHTEEVIISPKQPLELSEAKIPQLLVAPEKPVFLNPPQKNVDGLYGETAYVLPISAKAFHRPVWTFDGVVKSFPYAAAVTVLGYEGRFARIQNEEGTLFILKDELTSHKEEIFAEFHTGEIYSSNHPDTKKVRRLIKDEFFTTELCMPLLGAEFVTYRLLMAGRSIGWKNLRPRLAGQWQNLLKGQMGIQIGIMPKTGAIFEYTKPDGSGFLGYTKAVHIDESIVIEGFGRMIEGEYREEALAKEVWHELRPVWITVL